MTAIESTLTGELFIAGERCPGGSETVFQSQDPRDGAALGPVYRGASEADVERACAAAAAALPVYGRLLARRRAEFLREIAVQIEANADAIVQRARAETGFPEARLKGEVGRTTGQLRLFADLIVEGSPSDLRRDSQGSQGSELRSRTVALGPVVVFAASNFPLAFSVAGGDTASALAAGCPVIVKAHEAHLGVGELVAAAVTKAAVSCELPAGVFSMLVGRGSEIGQALVADSRVQAVGFTGSQAAGMQIFRSAANRPDPIPVYAEMSSVNPSFLLPHALERNAEGIAGEFVASVTLGAGQYCTNPGLLVLPPGSATDRFLDQACALLQAQPAQTMLSARIHEAYQREAVSLAGEQGITALHNEFADPVAPESNEVTGSLLVTDAATFLQRPQWQQEIFGPLAMTVRCADAEELAAVAEAMGGQLTASLHADPEDAPLVGRLLPTLERCAGRIVFNEWPTGVRVGDAMVHGGPFPATTAGGTTSVGARAIDRFLRPVCYQNVPEWAMPEGLSDKDIADLPRRSDGRFCPSS